MSIRRAQLFAYALSCVAIASCSDATSESTRGTASLSVVPVLASDGIVLQQTGPITRIRLTAKQTPGGTIIETETVAVPADAEEWRLDFGIPVPSGPDIQVLVTIELLSVEGGVETVQWSGVAGPFTLTPGPLGGPTQVPIVRGPLENVDVTGVNITTESPTVDEGRTVPLAAQVSGGGTGTVVFWTSLDPEVATVNDQGVVTGLVPGSARIVATAGAHSDQVSVGVTVRLATIQVSPSPVTLASIGATQQFTAKAFDPRGAEMTGITFDFSVAPASVATHDGNGLMRAVGNGSATVTATARGTPGTATLTVQQVGTSILISPPNPVIQTIGGNVTLTAAVRDANSHPVAGAAVTWETLTPGVAIVNSSSGVVTAVGAGVAQIRARSGTLTATVGVSVGSQVLFADGFETAAWTMGGLANVTNGAGISNTAAPTFVSPPGTTLPAAPQGSLYLWFGGASRGNYLGNQNPDDVSGSGGTSSAPTGGGASSTAFAVPAGIGTVFVSFQSWFEIESFDPSGFDLMTVEVIDANSSQVIASRTLNAGLSGAGEPPTPETSAGGALEPVFVPIELAASGVSGRTIRVRFTFDTGDENYNGFRGWIVDNVRVGTTPSAGPAMQAQVQSMELCALTGCAKPVSRRR